MKLTLSKLYLAFIALCGCLVLGACQDIGLTDDPENPGNQLPPNDSPVVMLHISAINAGNRNTNILQEKIKSLRIIMIHEEPESGVKRLEANRLIDAHDKISSEFIYLFQKRTAVGKKKFYLIANEESVSAVTLLSSNDDSASEPQEPDTGDTGDSGGSGGSDVAGGDNLPDTQTGTMSLKQFLNKYEPDMVMDDFGGGYTAPKEDPGGNYAKRFEEQLNALYFEPLEEGSYKIDKDNGDVFLPYSAYYNVEIKESDGYEVDLTGEPMYLVPVATKFTFKFINERKSDTEGVYIDYLMLEKTNKSNYLMANLEPEEHTKKIAGKDYYWIDWLKYVCDALNTEDTDKNVSDNTIYGWIEKYHTPKDYLNADEPDESLFDFVKKGWISSVDELRPPYTDDPWHLDAPEQDEGGKMIPSETTFGPIYLPEGHYRDPEGPNNPEDPEGEDTEGEGTEGTDTPNDNPGDGGGTTDPTAPDNTDGEQQETDTTQSTWTDVEKYFIRIKMRNASYLYPDDNPENESKIYVKTARTEISNLKYLFRNTHVVITITLREGGVSIYAQQEDWNPKWFWGYVKDQDEIK